MICIRLHARNMHHKSQQIISFLLILSFYHLKINDTDADSQVSDDFIMNLFCVFCIKYCCGQLASYRH